MRFRSARALLAAAALAAVALAAATAHATAEAVRTQIAARLQAQLPGMKAEDFVLGAAAFDEELRAAGESRAAGAAAAIEAGRKLWDAKFRDGRTLASCFPNGGRRIATVYPLYDARLKKPVTLEMAVNQCRKTHGEALFEATDSQTMGVVVAYVRSLANGQKIAVRVPAAAEERFELGRRMYFTRMGQRNFACASCHVRGAGKRYGDVPLAPLIGQATRWPLVRNAEVVTLQMSIRACLERMGAAPFASGSDELASLEYFLAYLSNGLPVRVNGSAAR